MFACTPDGAVPTLRHHPSSEWFGYSIPGTVGPIPRLRSRTPIVQPAARARALTIQAAQRAARARIELAIVIPLIAIVLLANEYRREVFGLDLPVRVFTAIALLILGWRLARDIGRTLAPQLFRRMDPATAGTVGFLIRLGFLVGAVLLALRVAGLEPRTIAVSGAIVAVFFGLAAQQTLGNLIAGVVLISVRPFRVGDRVRLQSGGLAGEIEGVVSTLGLLYTTFARGEDSIMVPNNIVLSAAVVPLREPSSVDLRARLRPDVMPSEVQELLHEGVRTPVRSEPHIGLEEIDSDEVIVRIAATPASDSDGPRLADEILAAIAPVTREGLTEERAVARRDDDGRRDQDGRRDETGRPAARPARARYAGVRVLGTERRRRLQRAEDGLGDDRHSRREHQRQRYRGRDRGVRRQPRGLAPAVRDRRRHAALDGELRRRSHQPAAVPHVLGGADPLAPAPGHRARLAATHQRPAREPARAPLPVREQLARLVELVGGAARRPQRLGEPAEREIGRAHV